MMSNKKHPQPNPATEYYPPEVVALALNFTECIFDEGWEDECPERDQRLLAALAAAGHPGLDLDKLNESFTYYFTADFDYTDLPEYSTPFPYEQLGEAEE